MPGDNDVWNNVHMDWGGKSAPTDASIENAKRILERLKPLDMLPDIAERGYWETTILSWKDRPVDMEIFDTRVEKNAYPPLVSGRQFEVYEFDSVCGSDWNRLSRQLKSLFD